MVRWIVIGCLWAGLVACGGAKTPAAAPPGNPPENVGAPGGDAYGAAGEGEGEGEGEHGEGLGEGDVDPACVRACVQQNQMRAVSPEQIEADCRAGCTLSK
jgi:hypothetical protein